MHPWGEGLEPEKLCSKNSPNQYSLFGNSIVSHNEICVQAGAPASSAIRGSRVLQGRVWGSRLLQLLLWCRHRGSQRLLPWVRGVRDRARVRDRVVPLLPRRGAAPPPPPSVGGQGGRRSAAVRHGGGRAARGADRQGRPAQRRDAAARLPPRGGGALEPGLHPASAVIGRGGRPTPHSRTCICRRGWGSAQPEIWAGTLLGGSHIGRRPRCFRRAAIRWGGRGG